MTEPKITVTEGDRRAATIAYNGIDSMQRERVAAWVATGKDGSWMWNELAEHFARARTMAAFDERVSCVHRWLSSVPTELIGIQLDDAELSLAEIADVGCDMVGDFMLARTRSKPTDDDIRALVLAGREGTT